MAVIQNLRSILGCFPPILVIYGFVVRGQGFDSYHYGGPDSLLSVLSGWQSFILQFDGFDELAHAHPAY